jgi:cyclopropane fatty-acyl-phospholipid synthase-like methyltransferase
VIHEVTSSPARFPRARQYHPSWVRAAVSGGANPLWLTEWLTERMDLRPGMRVLDLGCGRAASSIFLWREFGVQVWAVDLWFNASENLRRVRDAGAEEGVFPLRMDARTLPFPSGFFDAIVSMDAYPYFGTDDLYLWNAARLLRPDGVIGIAGAGLVHELGDDVPDHLRAWWTPELAVLHSAAWWQHHWRRARVVDVTAADTMDEGWRVWRDWIAMIAPDNQAELDALDDDRGRVLGYVRIVGRRQPGVSLDEPITSVPTTYEAQPLLAPHL